LSFVTLSESKTAGKGNIVVLVTNIGDLKAGSSSNGDWTRKDITVQDGSGKESMSVWNKDIEKFSLNHKYELSSIYWKENKGKQYLNFGQYSTLRDCGISIEENQTSMESSPKQETAPSSDQFLKQKQEQIKKDNEELDKKLDAIFTEDQKNNIEKEIDIIHAIELLVTKKLKTNTIDPNPAKVGMYVKFIYDKIGHFQK